jgi:ribonuclease HI
MLPISRNAIASGSFIDQECKEPVASAKTAHGNTRSSDISDQTMTASAMSQVELYTDGACSGNPGPGGWAFILRHGTSGKVMEQSGGEHETTNNRMELLAVIRGLEALKRPCRVILYTDSVYVGKGLTEWMPKWKKAGWKRKEGDRYKPVKNDDLWKRLDELIGKHSLQYIRVAGHSGHPENDRCDLLAVEAYRNL